MIILKPSLKLSSHAKAARFFAIISPVDIVNWKLANNRQERIAAISLKKSLVIVMIATVVMSLFVTTISSQNLTAYAPPIPSKDVRDFRQAAFKEFKNSPPQALIENNRSIKKGSE